MWFFSQYSRRFFRSYMKPMPPEVARKWLYRVRVLYLTLAGSSFFLALHYFKSNDEAQQFKDLDPTYSHKMARFRGQPGKTAVYKLNLGKGVEYFEFENEEYIEDYARRRAELEKKIKSQKETLNTTDSASNEA